MDRQRMIVDYLDEINPELRKFRRVHDMKKMIIGLVIFAAAGYGLLSYHFVLLDDNMKILKKTGPRVENTFVDARGAKTRALAFKPDLIAAGINDVIADVGESVRKDTSK
jgi:hypothetical protein